MLITKSEFHDAGTLLIWKWEDSLKQGEWYWCKISVRNGFHGIRTKIWVSDREGNYRCALGLVQNHRLRRDVTTWIKKSLLEVPFSLQKEKQGVAQPVVAPPPPTVCQPCFLPGYQLCAGLSLGSACGSGSDRDAEKAAEDSPVMTLHVTDWGFHRARIILAGIFAGQEEKGRTQELREPERCFWQPGQVCVAKHFINSGPDSPLWLDRAQHKARIGEQRWLGATFLLLHSGAAGDWLVPRVGSSRLRRW